MFKFNWQFFNVKDLQSRCKSAFTESVKQTRQPPSIAEPIRATNIDFGTKPPEIIFKAIKTVSLCRTHLQFKVKYQGDASITLETAVHANPLLEPFNDADFPNFVKPKVVFALSPFVLPFEMKILNVEIDTLIDVVYTPQGVIVSFENEPVRSLKVETSLDMLPMINEMITNILKLNLQMSFEEDIPESVWASTSPSKSNPDPFYGIRRWSQHLITPQKVLPTFHKRIEFTKLAPTLAFNTNSLPRFCLLNVCVKHVEREQEEVNLSAFLVKEEANKPRRRVISLRKNTNSTPIQSPIPSPPMSPISFPQIHRRSNSSPSKRRIVTMPTFQSANVSRRTSFVPPLPSRNVRPIRSVASMREMNERSMNEQSMNEQSMNEVNNLLENENWK